MNMTAWEKRLLELAKEVHELQLKQTDLQLSDKKVGVSSETIKLVAKINFLVGYIMSLEKTYE